jgi:outer membrane protein TolC
MRGVTSLLLVLPALLTVTFAKPTAVESEDLSFVRALELAEERSEILMLQASAVKRAGLALAEARSKLGPELTFEAGGGYMAHPPLKITVTEGAIGKFPNPTPPPVLIPVPDDDVTFPEDRPRGYVEFSLQLSQPLYTWGKLKSSVQLAGLGLESSRAELAKQRRQLQEDLHKAYFTTVLARDSLGLLRQILDILEEIEEDRRRAFELGSVNRLSVLEIQTQIAEVKRRIVQAEQAQATAQEAIALYTDLEPESLELTAGFRRERPGFSETQLKNKAMESSPLVKMARLDQERARANLELTRGGASFRPDLALNFSFQLSGQVIPSSETDWYHNLIAGVGAQGGLFDSGRSGHKIRRAEEALSASQKAIDLLTKQVGLQVRQAVEQLELRWIGLEESRAAVAQAEEEEKNAGQSFEQQLLIREQWGLTRIALFQKRLVLLEAEYSFELALYELESLAGFH